MPIKVAKSAGFCFGVSRAVDIVVDEIEKGTKVATLGEIIHNPQLVEQLKQKGVKVIDTPMENEEGYTVIIRSHGVSKDVYRQLDQLGINYIDATCPFVSKIHDIVEKTDKDKDIILIAGDNNHPEVIGILGFCTAKAYTFLDEQELASIFEKIDNNSDYNYILVAQTTFNTTKWLKCQETAKKVYTNLNIFDTICIATSKRQNEATEIAKQSDLMVVVGGKHSSNTAKLFEMCGKYCQTIFIETAKELENFCLGGKNHIGVTAGASTPACIIKEVQETMSEILKNQEDEMTFEELLAQEENSFKSTYNGEKVTGVVTSIMPNEIAVDIGTKHAGYVPLGELTADPNAKTEDLVKKGDKIELLVIRVNDVEGTAMLSKRRLDAIAGFDKIIEASENGTVLEGVITDSVKGGLLAVTNGVKIFIPASQATANRNDDVTKLLKQKVSFKILEVNKPRHRAVGSIRAIENEKRKEAEKKFWDSVEEGQKFTGKVKSITSYGAFVDLGGVDGMVHISELSWSRIKHPSEVVSVGDEIQVNVREIDKENRKISLGYKTAETNPWTVLKSTYEVGSVVKAKIVSMTAFGAFAQIIPGIDGLIHISQISNERVEKPQDVLKVGQEVDVKITEIDYDKKRVSLSIKALLEDDAEEATEE
ncbi:MAG: bifunctional 4-hydroxy-3-methylbut-2-enyl diphosphate reductase/30S ribosomal protein S1 [Oscillospiraceae bacterium]